MKTSWADEPGDHLWVIRRKGSEVSISILWFKDWYHADDIRAGKKVFTASCQLAHLGRVVLRELSRLKDLVGVEAYAQRWGRPFPAEEMTDLAEAIAA